MSQPALDKMVAIADAFDRGAFNGLDIVDTDTVARVVGLSSNAVSRLLGRLGVKKLKDGRSVKQRHDRVYEYPPRIRLPDSTKIRQPDARLVVEAIADQRLPRKFDTALLYHRLGESINGGTIGPQGHLPRPLHKALLRSGFTSHREEGFKEKAIWQPATWSPPRDSEDWPPLFQRQRKLRERGLRPSAVYRLTDSAAGLEGIIQDAMEQLDLSRVPYDQRGALKGQIHGVIKQAYLALLTAQNETMQAERETVNRDVDWQSVLTLSDSQLRNFTRIMARVSQSEAFSDPGAYALRWALENSPGAATDGIAVSIKSNEHASAV